METLCMADIFDEILEDDDIPTDEELKSIRKHCQLLAVRQDQKREAEARLKELNKEIWELEMRTIPDLAAEIGVDTVGLPEIGVDIRIRPYYKANIAAEWPEEQRERAFEYLEEIGVGDIIKTEVRFQLGRDSLEELSALLRAARQVPGLPDPTVGKQVPWNTLTSTVRELVEKGEALNLDVIGAVVGQRATIKERK